MPVKTKRDEEKWDKAKEIAKAKGRGEDWAYIMGIYKRMKPDYQFKTKEAAVAFRFILGKLDLSDKDKVRVVDLLAEGKGKPIPDSKVHALAEDLGMDADELESYIYSFASLWAINEKARVNPGGRAEAKGVSEKDFDPKEIQKGIKVEMEHTKDKALSKKIVLDHLAESPHYYEALDKMEKGLEAKGGD